MGARNQPDDSEDAQVDDTVRTAFTGPTPPEVRARLRPHFEALRARTNVAGADRYWGGRGWRPLRAAAALLLAVAAFAAGSMAVNIGPRPTWADVVEKFGAVHGLQADIYIEERAGGDPVHIALWMGQGGLTRMHAGHEISFGRQGRIVDSFLLEDEPLSPRIAAARNIVRGFVEAVGAADAFSLETLIAVLPGSTGELRVLESQATAPSHDLIVFDMAGEREALQVRIWALRRSRLPVRVLFRDPASGERVDVTLSYTDIQPGVFFDPLRFGEALDQSGGGLAPDDARTRE